MRFLFLILILSGSNAWAALPIPRGMTGVDRHKAAEILGFGTGYKVLGNPYPLGGYSGYEVGLSMDFIDTSVMADLGTKASEQATTSYFAVSLSKGLFYGIDFALQFSPLGQNERFSGFGGALRWGFAEMASQPVHFSLQATANSGNFQELINTTTQSFDFIAGYTRDAWSLYVGTGLIRTSALFIGGVNGVNFDQSTVTESIASVQTFGGLSVNWADYFLALQASRVVDSNYALKLGARF